MDKVVEASQTMDRQAFARRARTALALVAALSLAAGCGGGSGSPTVSTLSATNVAYSRTMLVSVSGQALDQGIAMTVDSGCGAVTQVAGGSDATQQFSCRIDAVGPLTVRIATTGGKRLASLQLTTPLPQVSLATTKGTIVMELDPETAPVSVTNFLDYLHAGYYRNVVFHRVIPGFVIQTGGFATGLVGKTATRPPIVLESNRGRSNLRGTVGVARETLPDTGTSQFYFNLVDNPLLDYVSDAQPGYAVFGRVIQGLDVIDAIAAVPTAPKAATIGGQTQVLPNVPVDEIVLTTATQLK